MTLANNEFTETILPLECYVAGSKDYDFILQSIEFAASYRASWTSYFAETRQHVFRDEQFDALIDVLRHVEFVARAAQCYRLAGHMERAGVFIMDNGEGLSHVSVAIRERGPRAHDLIVSYCALAIDNAAD